MAITIVNTGLGTTPDQNNIVLSIGTVFTLGSCVVAFVSLQDTTKSITGFTDDTDGGAMTFSLVAALNVTGVRIEAWSTTVSGGHANGSFLRANMSGVSEAAGTMIEFTGAASIGAHVSANNTTADPTISLTTQDVNNYVAAGFAMVGGTLPTSKTGTLQRKTADSGASPVANALVSNTAASASSVTDAITLAAATWAAIAIELRTGGGVAAGQGPGLLMLGIG